MDIKTVVSFNCLKPVVYLLTLSLALGCASFPKRVPPSHLNAANVHNLNGTYNLTESLSAATTDSTSIWNLSESDLSMYPTFFDELNNGILVKGIPIDSTKQYSFSLKILDSKKMQFDYLENDSLVCRNLVRYKLKKDGFVNINHKNFKIFGIPYFFGGFDKKRSRLSLTPENDLLFETSEFRSGAILFLIMDPMTKMKYEKIYKRLN